MNEVADYWYIRLPDGRTFRATSTAAVRQQLGSGRLPPGTLLSRSSDDSWQAPARLREFSDLATPPDSPSNRMSAPTVASRLDPQQFHLLGVRSLINELLAALDSFLTRRKFRPTVLAALLLAILAAVASRPEVPYGLFPPGWGWLFLAAGLLGANWLTVLLARISFFELSRLKSARWNDVRAGMVPPAFALTLVHGLVIALLLALVIGVRELPAWIMQQPVSDGPARWARDLGVEAVVIVGLLLIIGGVVWSVLLLQLPPLLVVEDCRLITGLRQWMSLVRQHRWRILLYHILAVGLSVPILVPLYGLAALVPGLVGDARFVWAALIVRGALLTLMATVLLGYLSVANVFIYLNLRYESRQE